jgi:hypothetical protein
MIPGMKLKTILRVIGVIGIGLLVLESSVALPGDKYERARAYTRNIEFDFLGWTLDALGIKIGQAALGTESYLTVEERPQLVLDYLDLLGQIGKKEGQLSEMYANPDIPDPAAASAELRAELEELYSRRAKMQPLAEEIFQDQIATIAAEQGLALGGETLPPVLYHTTPLPLALIISPRDKIQQDANISISPDLTVDEMNTLEDRVDNSMNVSSLVVRVGGIGLYPTMVMQTTDINWLAEVISHEWVHNYLTLRPLGINYMSSPQMRAVNETVASLAGKELGQMVIARYYPQFLPEPPPPTPTPAPGGAEPTPTPSPEPPAFDFRAEMHTTRLEVDELLADGKIEQAEEYMETRRRFFWDNGYHFRKLNQAYFAFYGAYADQPGGAAGTSEDIVGNAVRAMRAQSNSLAEFLNRISWMWSFEQLERAVSQN